ncbi:MAG: GMC oxidoreductase [Methylobacter sp.]
MSKNTSLLEAVVIGSGFGGAISCCRLAQKWGNQVMLLERGKRYPMGSFPRSPYQMAANFWNLPGEKVKRPKHIKERTLRGMFDIRVYTRMDAVICAGYGGGSLIYANVFLEPPVQVFERGWPSTLNKTVLQPYYEVAKSVLGARPIPPENDDPRRRIIRTELFQEFAADQGRKSTLADLCVFFGNNFNQPTEIGLQEQNRYGATQTSCTYCAECDVGCNTHSKNTLDLNYLFVAEHVHKAQIQTDCVAEKIVPLDKDGQEDTAADGSHGYRVYYQHLDNGPAYVDTRRVVVSAGTLGTNELLLRCRDEYGTLPRLSQKLGQRFSGNGDFLSFVTEGKKPADPNYGPVITQYTDYNLFENHDPERAFVLEDASYPSFGAWLAEGLQPAFNPIGMVKKVIRIAKTIWSFLRQYLGGGKWTGSIGNIFYQILDGDVSYRSSILLCMGLDKGDGVLTLRDGNLDLDWPQQNSMPLYQAILDSGKKFKRFVHSCLFTPLPTWKWPMNSNITVHSLGGCILADSPEQGVVSAAENDRGQAFGYKGLYVADGSVLPSAVGSNPIATISAVSEWIAEGITGHRPSDDLKAKSSK